tara:strand:+ start:415 stop:747 length:333 start_codon:yes stop_codon:yes gene_type:complete
MNSKTLLEKFNLDDIDMSTKEMQNLIKKLLHENIDLEEELVELREMTNSMEKTLDLVSEFTQSLNKLEDSEEQLVDITSLKEKLEFYNSDGEDLYNPDVSVDEYTNYLSN